MSNKMIRMIDLFSGAGGLTAGFVATGRFTSVWANDLNADAARSYNLNFGEHCVAGDILEIIEKHPELIPNADLVIGGPPCQGFSLLNKNRKNDPRKQMWRPFLEVVRLSGANSFVIENVPQILGTEEHESILAAVHELGFSTTSMKVCAADYGVPQTRWRAFIIGSRSAEPNTFFPPKKTHFKPDAGREKSLFETISAYIPRPDRWKTVRDAIADLPPPKGVEIRDVPVPLNLHFGRTPTDKSLARYKAIPKEGMNRFDLLANAPEITPGCWIRKTEGGTDLFGRLWWDRPAFTIRTEFFKPEKGRYLHPRQHRPLTHREAARLQSFPDTFVFSGSKIEIARQIGNAVPPLLAQNVAESICAMLGVGKSRDYGRLHEGTKKPDDVEHQKARYVA